MPASTTESRKKRHQFMVVDRHDFERRLKEARQGLSARAVRQLMEGYLLAAATIGPVVWAFTARQAVFLRMVREAGYSRDGVFGRFVALSLDEWRRECRAPIVALDRALHASAAAPHPVEVERFIDAALAEIGQFTLFPGSVLDPPRPDDFWRSKRDRARDQGRQPRQRRRRDPGRSDRVEVQRRPSPQLSLFAAAR